jgi:hypothetical protein
MLNADDRLAIMELSARYNWAVDTRDAEAYAGSFVADGVFDGGTEYLQGHEALKEFVSVLAASSKAAGLQHWTTNFVFRELEPGRCEVRSYMMGPRDNGEQVVVGVLAHYRDIVAKTTSGWLFETRTWREWTDIPSWPNSEQNS